MQAARHQRRHRRLVDVQCRGHLHLCHIKAGDDVGVVDVVQSQGAGRGREQ
jgi:hypothetical protein